MVDMGRGSVGGADDLTEMMVIDRVKLTRQFVDQMERVLHEIERAREELRAIKGSAKGSEFSKTEIKAMEDVAKLRMKDERLAAAVRLSSLKRIADACNFELFDLAELGV